MKQYKHIIKGNLYKVSVNDIDENNIATAEVNGIPYQVDIETPVVPKPIGINNIG